MRRSTSPPHPGQGRRRRPDARRADRGDEPRRHPDRGDRDAGDHRRLPGAQGRRGRPARDAGGAAAGGRRRRLLMADVGRSGSACSAPASSASSTPTASATSRTPASSRTGAPARSAARRSPSASAAARSTPIDAVCADPEVDLVVVSLPNHLHLEAVRSAASHGKAVACTKPLGRNGDEAAEMLRLVDATAGVFHAYLENVVYGTEMVRMREMVEAGRDRPADDVPCPRGPQRPARRPLLGRRAGRRRRAARHGLARRRGGPLRSSARTPSAGTSSPGARRSSTATGRPARTTRS